MTITIMHTRGSRRVEPQVFVCSFPYFYLVCNILLINFSSWTCGTGLMPVGPTNIVAHELESHSVHTFSAQETVFNILGLMLFSITQVEPIWADLNGGMDCLSDLNDITTRIRSKINKKADLCCAVARDNSADFKIINGVAAEHLFQTVNILPRANFCFNFLPSKLWDGSIFFYYHQVDLSKFLLEHSNYFFTFSLFRS